MTGVRLYRTLEGPVAERYGRLHAIEERDWDLLFNRDDLLAYLEGCMDSSLPLAAATPSGLLPPIGSQEVWACGVTYRRSREARMEESKGAGGSDFYARAYGAERPEIFFKATAHRVVGHAQCVRLRRDARWSVPEPEITLAVSRTGRIVGYTIGNDVSSRDLEGENPLYLPQAKIYDGSCALGPCLYVTDDPLPGSTAIEIEVRRRDAVVFDGRTTFDQMIRTPEELVSYLIRECAFPQGCFLLTGTGIVPGNEVGLLRGDEIRITIEPIGTLHCGVA